MRVADGYCFTCSLSPLIVGNRGQIIRILIALDLFWEVFEECMELSTGEIQPMRVFSTRSETLWVTGNLAQEISMKTKPSFLLQPYQVA